MTTAADQQLEEGRSGRNATLRDVAALAGVSITTVSKALNGRQHVRAETRRRVQLAAEELAFVPNTLAQGLLAGRTKTVGLLASDLDGRFSLPVMMGAEDAFGTDKTSVFLCDARGDRIREQHHLRALLSRRVDGLIVVGDTTNPRTSLGHSLGVPAVYAYAPSLDSDDISVISDNVEAGRAAAEHLLDCGRRRIGYISGDRSYRAATDRVAGATARLAEEGMELLSGRAWYGSWSEEWGRRGTQSLLRTHGAELDAVLCGSDQIGRGVLDALREAGRSVPADVAVMGHDNWEPMSAVARPPLSSMDMQLEELGRQAAALLFAAIDGRVASGLHPVTARLVLRSSTLC